MKKKETPRLGKLLQADRVFNDDEFSQLVNLMGTQGRLVNSQRFQAMAKFQVHLIEQSDNMAHIQKCNLKQGEFSVQRFLECEDALVGKCSRQKRLFELSHS